MSIEKMRKQYSRFELNESEIATDPLKQFDEWFQQARAEIRDEDFEANAMALATCDQEGNVSNRIVLLKGYDSAGFRFYTNYESRKGIDLKSNPRAALLFYWHPLHRQIRIEGRVEQTTREDSKKYFDERPRNSRISAIISPQSQVVSSRSELEAEFEKLDRQIGDTEPELPDVWGGYQLQPDRFEFWQGRENRLHDRIQYTLVPELGWRMERLGP